MGENAGPGGVPEELGNEIVGAGRRYFDDVVVDNVVDALLELSAALWVVRDRQIVTERVLAERGIDVSDLIEQHTPGDEETRERAAERERFTRAIFRSFLRRPGAEDALDPDAPSYREMEDKQ